MPKKPHTAEQIIMKLRETEVLQSKGQTMTETCRQLSITEQTYYKRRKEYNQRRPHCALGYKPPAPETILPYQRNQLALDKEITNFQV
jgi:hypothetical protein